MYMRRWAAYGFVKCEKKDHFTKMLMAHNLLYNEIKIQIGTSIL